MSTTALRVVPDRPVTGELITARSATAVRFRALLKTLIGQALADMGAVPFAMVIRPFLPMILPVVDEMSDDNALAILDFLKNRISYVETGVETVG